MGGGRLPYIGTSARAVSPASEKQLLLSCDSVSELACLCTRQTRERLSQAMIYSSIANWRLGEREMLMQTDGQPIGL